ncbi:MAG: glycosyltransferase [Desulfobulbus sp.]|nr:glycosyltransferase [Desulfobulbus sp.]
MTDNKEATFGNPPALSIIVPVYNAEPWLARCLDSLVHQPIRNIEIIVIDDQSTDGSLNIVREYEKKDPRIQIIALEKNSGQAVARNAGLAVAAGEYIGFVDSDDFVDVDFYEKLLAAAGKTDADIVMGGYIRKEGALSTHKRSSVDGVVRQLSDKILRLVNGSCCDKIFRATLIKEHKLQFPAGLYFEDNVFLVHAVYYSDKMAFVSDAFYNYFRNPAGTTSAKGFVQEAKRKADRFVISEEIMRFAQVKHFDKEAMIGLRNFLMRSIMTRKDFRGWDNYDRLSHIFGSSYTIRTMFFCNPIVYFFYRDIVNDDGARIIKIFKWIPVYQVKE